MVLCVLKDVSRGEERGKWGGGSARACGRSPLEAEARGRGLGIVGSGSRLGLRLLRVRREWGGSGWLEMMKLTGGPGLSAGERGE